MTPENELPKKTPAEAESGAAVGCSALLGRCVEAGNDDNGQPMMLIHTTRDALMRQVRNVVFEDVAIIRADELDAAEVVAFDGQARTITLRFDLMPCAAIGEKWLIRPNDKLSDGANNYGLKTATRARSERRHAVR